MTYVRLLRGFVVRCMILRNLSLRLRASFAFVLERVSLSRVYAAVAN